jgi:hypothetical protein
VLEAPESSKYSTKLACADEQKPISSITRVPSRFLFITVISQTDFE